MKHLFVFISLLFLCIPVFAVFEFSAAADFAFAQDFIKPGNPIQINADLRASFEDDFELRLPVTLTFDGKPKFLDAGLDVVYYPYENGLFMGLSVVQMGSEIENLKEISFVNLNEMLVGWTLQFKNGLFLEPSLVIRNPGGTYTDEYSSLLGKYPCYTTFRFRLLAGYKFTKAGGRR